MNFFKNQKGFLQWHSVIFLDKSFQTARGSYWLPLQFNTLLKAVQKSNKTKN